VSDLNIKPDVLNRWFALADDSELDDGPELIDALIQAWKEAGE
jgi:hypothetical protein